MRTIAALAACLALAAPALAAAPRPPKPPKPAACRLAPSHPRCADEQPAPAPRVQLSVEGGELVLRAAGLEPGARYDYTFEVRGCGNPAPYYRGGSTGRAVAGDGAYAASEALDDVYYWAAPYRPCEVAAWLRPQRSSVFDVSTFPDGAPILAEHDFY